MSEIEHKNSFKLLVFDTDLHMLYSSWAMGDLGLRRAELKNLFIKLTFSVRHKFCIFFFFFFFAG
jgi:hypothetical protein